MGLIISPSNNVRQHNLTTPSERYTITPNKDNPLYYSADASSSVSIVLNRKPETLKYTYNGTTAVITKGFYKVLKNTIDKTTGSSERTELEWNTDGEFGSIVLSKSGNIPQLVSSPSKPLMLTSEIVDIEITYSEDIDKIILDNNGLQEVNVLKYNNEYVWAKPLNLTVHCPSELDGVPNPVSYVINKYSNTYYPYNIRKYSTR